jgi:hypothetical protein
MNSITEIMPLESAAGRSTSVPRLFNICYLTAIAVATIGWLSAFGWAAVRITEWFLA